MSSAIVLSILFLASLLLFIFLYLSLKNTELFSKAIILGLAAFFLSSLLHYILPSLLFQIFPWMAMPLTQAFLLTACIEDGIRYQCLRFIRQENTLKTASALMVVALVFATLESHYYWNVQSGFIFVFVRLLGALPLHLGCAFIMASIPRAGLWMSITFHGLYNYFLAISAPLIMSAATLVLMLLIAVIRFKQLKTEETPPQIKYF